MLTIFSTPKAFVGHNKVIQENAIESWTRLDPASEVILIGNDRGTAETAARFGCKHVAGVKCNDQGTPLVSSLFSEAEKIAANPVMCYVNCDIMFTNTLMAAIPLLSGRRRYLMVGRRYNVDITSRWDFSRADWGHALAAHAASEGRLNSPRGIDYFIYPRGQFKHIPDLAVGRAWWDNWMIFNAKRHLIPVIDATAMVLAVHQTHDYSHIRGGVQEAYFEGPEVERNRSYLKGGDILMTIADAEWNAGNGEIRFSRDRLRRHIVQLPLIWPLLGWPVALCRLSWRFAKRLTGAGGME